MKQTRNKYKNTKFECNGIIFDSKKEAARYLFLLDCQSQNLISELTLQPKWEIIPAIRETIVKQTKNGEKKATRTKQLAATYTADFSYVKNGELVVEDVKSAKDFESYRKFMPKDFPIKKKLMLWRHNIDVKLIFNPTEEV